MSEFVDYLTEVFEQFGPIQAKRMFGGYGIYHDGLMFALVADDTLFLKTDKTITHFFESMHLPQFEYDRKGKLIKMSYHQAPEELFEDREMAAEWASRSFQVALIQKRS